MYREKIEERLAKELGKVAKKNPKLILILDRKIEEILLNPYHYKPLRGPMKNKRRVHIGKHVLVYQINEEEKIIEFLRLKHHDKVYVDKKGKH